MKNAHNCTLIPLLTKKRDKQDTTNAQDQKE